MRERGADEQSRAEDVRQHHVPPAGRIPVLNVVEGRVARVGDDDVETAEAPDGRRDRRFHGLVIRCIAALD
jgi:hypothetical protein